MTRERSVLIPSDGLALEGSITTAEQTRGFVVFAHGSGSSRHSPRNRYVADELHARGLGTLLFDLLAPEEEVDRENVFDIPLLAERLSAADQWLRHEPEAKDATIGWFGASTGAGAALWAAGADDAEVAAVVSRGGRPDLAGPRLGSVRAPTLLIVGGSDSVVLDLNEQAARAMRCTREVAVVPGATHLFEERGALEQVASLAGDWFVDHLTTAH